MSPTDEKAFEIWSQILSRLATIEAEVKRIGGLELRVAQLERDRSQAIGYAIGASATISLLGLLASMIIK